MTSSTSYKRIDSASRIIKASPKTIYRAFLDPAAWALWLPPEDMRGKIHEFEAWDGGVFHMELTYVGTDHITHGKTTEHSDVIKGRFLKFIPNKQVIQLVEFDSEDPIYAGEMIMTWTLAIVPTGTMVSIVCENVPEGIRKEDHDVGLRLTLQNLANYSE